MVMCGLEINGMHYPKLLEMYDLSSFLRQEKTLWLFTLKYF